MLNLQVLLSQTSARLSHKFFKNYWEWGIHENLRNPITIVDTKRNKSICLSNCKAGELGFCMHGFYKGLDQRQFVTNDELLMQAEAWLFIILVQEFMWD
jgi:hypothetical protein